MSDYQRLERLLHATVEMKAALKEAKGFQSLKTYDTLDALLLQVLVQNHANLRRIEERDGNNDVARSGN